MLYAGIDIAKATLQVCVWGANKVQKEFANSRTGHQHLVRWLKKQGDTAIFVGMEATGSYGEAVCEYL